MKFQKLARIIAASTCQCDNSLKNQLTRSGIDTAGRNAEGRYAAIMKAFNEGQKEDNDQIEEEDQME